MYAVPAPDRSHVALLGLVLLLPWTTWLTVTTVNPNVAVRETPIWFCLMGGLGLLAYWLWQQDRWLGLIGGWVVIRALPVTYQTTFEVLVLTLLGLAALAVLRDVPRSAHRWAVTGLLVMAVLQVGYVLVQAAGYDPIWRWMQHDQMRRLGTLGNEEYVGIYLAMLAPLASVWLLPVFALGFWLVQSWTGLFAATAGLLLRYRLPWWGWVALIVPTLFWLPPPRWYSLGLRMKVWWIGMQDGTWATWLFGHGLGSWIVEQPPKQPTGLGEQFYQAHNDYVQWLYELGLIGLVLLGCWLWRHRGVWRTRYAPALVSLALCAGVMFPFRLAVLGMTGVALLGLAWNEAEAA